MVIVTLALHDAMIVETVIEHDATILVVTAVLEVDVVEMMVTGVTAVFEMHVVENPVLSSK